MLNICKQFFDYLNKKQIRYCHWKSNQYLNRSLAGKTDLDLLIHPKDKDVFEAALLQYKFKKILSPSEKQYPGLEDYLGFDYDTGTLIHLHLHYKLVLGQRHIKNHHLPIENIMFQNLTLKDGVYIPCPELELIMLIIRAHMKLDFISIIKHGIKDFSREGYTAFPAAIEEELTALIKCSNIEKLAGILRKSNLPLPEKMFIQFIDRFTSKKLKCYDLLLTQWKIFSDLKEFRRSKGIFVYLKYFYLTLKEMPFIDKLILHSQKTMPEKGKIFSIVGADGSGKSTLIKDLESWLSWKMSVKQYYYGIPKTRFVNYCYFTFRVVRKLKLNAIATFIDNCLWVYIAKQRCKISILSQKDISEGKIVLTDRLPLKAFNNMKEPMDGLRIINNSSKISMFFSKIEKSCYDKIFSSDGIFVLQASIEELRRRKGDTELSVHKEKAEAVNAIEKGAQTILVDANKEFPEVRLEVKRKIWEIL